MRVTRFKVNASQKSEILTSNFGTLSRFCKLFTDRLTSVEGKYLTMKVEKDLLQTERDQLLYKLQRAEIRVKTMSTDRPPFDIDADRRRKAADEERQVRLIELTAVADVQTRDLTELKEQNDAQSQTVSMLTEQNQAYHYALEQRDSYITYINTQLNEVDSISLYPQVLSYILSSRQL